MVDRVDVGEYRRVSENGRLLTGDYLLFFHLQINALFWGELFLGVKDV